MRILYALFLIAFTGAAAILAYENQQDVTLHFFDKTYHTSLPALVGASYLAGMLSGWTLLGLIRRSVNRVTRKPFPGE